MIKIETRIHLEAHKHENLFVHISCFDDRVDIRLSIGVSPRLNDTNCTEALEEQALNTISLSASEAFKISEFLAGAAAQAAEVGCKLREKELENIFPIKKP